jgi:hypothetical protein
VGYLVFRHSNHWLNECGPHLGVKSNFAVSIVWDLDCVNLMRLQIKAHRFTCASYNPFEVLHLDHIGPLTNGNEYILFIIDAFSRWVELFPTKSTTATETASLILNHVG